MVSLEDSRVERALQVLRTLVKIPAPPFGERERAEAFLEIMRERAGSVEPFIDSKDNVAVPLLPGRECLLVTAHLDTVFTRKGIPFSENEGAVCAPGALDDASGLGFLAALAEAAEDWKETVQTGLLAVATVGEEGPGCLRGANHVYEVLSGENDDPTWKRLSGMAIKSHVAIDGTLGRIVNRGLFVERRRAVLTGPGGHSWGSAGRPSAIARAAKAVSLLYRRFSPPPRGVSFNVGIISGGTSVNSIASECSFEFELRQERRQKLKKRLETAMELIRETVAGGGVRVQIEHLDSRYGGTTRRSTRLVRTIEENLRRHGVDTVFASGSTEANLAMARRIPGVAMGVAKGSGSHTERERMDKDSYRRGVTALLSAIEGILHL